MEMIKMTNFTTAKNDILSETVNDSRIRALKSLTLLLLREVEELEGSRIETIASLDAGKLNLEDEVHRYEIDLIRYALIQTEGHQRRAAKMLGVKVSTLNAKIKRYGIEPFNVVTRIALDS